MKNLTIKEGKLVYNICPFCKSENHCYKIRDNKIKGYRIFCDRLKKISDEVIGDFNKIEVRI